MIKTVQMGEKEIQFSTSFAWVFIYKSQFGKDPAQILLPAVRDLQGADEETAGYTLMEKLGFSGVTEISWAMARLADKKTPDPDAWIASLGDDFDLMSLVTDVLPEAIESCFTTKKSGAPIPPEK
jgi:hypothetical protein